MAETIQDYHVYTTGMSKSFKDKLFFLDKIEDITGMVDFGCADGALINHISETLDDICLVGYDINPQMVELAKRKGVIGNFTSDFNEALYLVNPNRSLLNLSSVIHEVYSYSLPHAVDTFWKNVFGSGFQYIAIRDFCISSSVNRKADINDWVKLIQNGEPCQIADYEGIWGSLRDNRNLLHFLLKYRYISNWEREVRENYFSLTLEKLLSKIPTDKYEIVYFQDYILPFTAMKIKEDFNIVIHDNTHIKLLLKKRAD